MVNKYCIRVAYCIIWFSATFEFRLTLFKHVIHENISSKLLFLYNFYVFIGHACAEDMIVQRKSVCAEEISLRYVLYSHI